ncbi:MAG: ABC transporter ATP-binding protein [Bacteroidales bacterium]
MLLQLENISKTYNNPLVDTGQVVLNKLSMEVEKGERVAILGPSGSGKSTLLNIIGTLESPDTGTVRYNEQIINELTQSGLNHFRNREIGFVFQLHHLLPQCNVVENVLIPTLVDKGGRKEKNELAENLLNRVGMWNHRYKYPGQLSGGECQRVALVRAMINQPALLLADEPTGALDGKNVGAITELLLQMNMEEHVALVVVTHSDALASTMGTIYELSEGHLQKK